MIATGRLALWLGAIFAAWTTVAAASALRRSRADIAALAGRGLLATAAASLVALGVLVRSLLVHDFGARFAAARTSLLTPARYLATAVLGAPAGALLAFAAAVGLAGIALARRNADGRGRAWTVATVAGLVSVALAIVIAAEPFARTFGFRPDGAILSPDLQSGLAVLHALALLGGATCAAAAFAMTVGALAARRLDERWSADARRWNALAWCALFIAAVAGYRWNVMSPIRGPWLDAPPTPLWLLPCATGAWLLHLDAGGRTPGQTVARVLLTAATFIAVCAAMAFGGGTFARGIADARDPTGTWFGVAGVGALAITIVALRRGRGALGGSRRPAGESVVRRVRPGVVRAAAIAAHAGLALTLAASVGARYARSYPVQLEDTGIFRVRDPLGHQWSFTSEGASTLARENYSAIVYSLRAARDGAPAGLLTSDARSYGLFDDADDAMAAIVAGVRSGPFMETRIEVADPATAPPSLRLTFVPLGSWLAPGAILIVAGTLAALAAGGTPRAD